MCLLFHEKPNLLERFNLFLSPGYRINLSADPRDPSQTTITTPIGTITSQIGAGIQSAGGGSTSHLAPPAAGPCPDTPRVRPHPPQTSLPPPQGLASADASILGNTENKTQVECAPAQRMIHDVRILSYSELEGTLPFCLGRNEALTLVIS